MSTPERRHFAPAAKVAILQKHLLEAWPVSEVCTEAGIAVSQFYQWQKIFFEHGAAAFETTRAKSAADDAKDKKIAIGASDDDSTKLPVHFKGSRRGVRG